MAQLCDLTCKPCREGADPLKGDELAKLQAHLDDAWEIVDEHHLRRNFKFRNFAEALAFVNRVGELAEQQGHHPDIHLSWGRVGIELLTHKIDGLTESDFVLAAKIDRL